jgi:hypothetical protein
VKKSIEKEDGWEAGEEEENNQVRELPMDISILLCRISLHHHSDNNAHIQHHYNYYR